MVELAKSIVAVRTPVSGSIVAINPALEQRPGLVHTDPMARAGSRNWR